MDPSSFFDMSVPMTTIQLDGGQTCGYVVPKERDDDFETRSFRSVASGQNYAAAYQEQYHEELRTRYVAPRDTAASGGHLDDLEELTSVGSMKNPADVDNDLKAMVHEQYTFRTNTTPLTITNYKMEIVRTVEVSQVCVLTGPTGCGKTTQVPQYILEAHRKAKKHCNIVVTQPRRIAAITVARRVCEEQGWELGTYCGYQIGLQKDTGPDTRLTYVTVGVLLQSLVCKKQLDEYTHIILDEVHERSQDMDFLLLVVKRLLPRNPHVKIILMSATLEEGKIAQYFSLPVKGELVPATVLDMKVKTNYAICIHYLDELLSLGTVPEIEYSEPGISEVGFSLCVKLLRRFEEIDKGSKVKNSVLIFLPGMYEIQEFHRLLTDPKERTVGSTTYNWTVIPLHSSLPTKELGLAFKAPTANTRKIILATNIAESSITVPDIKFVIDFCLTKILKTDLLSNFSSLQVTWASKSNCEQRAGRAGRVMDGKVYRMVPRFFYDQLESTCDPELLRAPLEKVVLQAKILDFGPPEALLALALDPPLLENISVAILLLKEIGAMQLTCDGAHSDTDGDITYLGQIMAKLPVDVKISKLLALGHVYSVLPDAIIMAAAMSLKNMFSEPFKDRMKAYVSKLTWANGSCSDLFAFLTVYQTWQGT